MKSYKNKEEILVQFLTLELRLNKYDSKFISNLAMLLSKNRYVTTNQDNLFNKLLVKYKRQLSKHKINVDEVLQLEWNTKVIESLPEFTEAHLSIENNQLKLRLPFNKKLIENLRQVDPYFNLTWNVTKKCYYSNFCTDILKIIINIIPHYYKLNLTDEIKQCLHVLNDYIDCKYWDPTLVKQPSGYYIVAANQYLLNAVEHVTLNNEPQTLCELSKHAIIISPDITNNDDWLEFCATYDVKMELDKLPLLHEYCNKLDFKNIICNYRIARIRELRNEIEKVFGTTYNIYYEKPINNITIAHNKKSYHGKTIGFYYGSANIAVDSVRYYPLEKIINIVNNRPVDIK